MRRMLLASILVLAPATFGFAQNTVRMEQVVQSYVPDVVLEITTDDSPLDFVAARYDAGIHLGEFIARDMIAVRVSNEQRAAIGAGGISQPHSRR